MQTEKNRILFIVKDRVLPNYDSYCSAPSGLSTSAKQVCGMLNSNHLAIAKVVAVTDNNCIDRCVTEFKPSTVIIEALWVVPEKFEILTKLHPNAKWIVRLHSDMPFLAHEGIAFEWLRKYVQYNGVRIAVNSNRIRRELSNVMHTETVYLPNYYVLNDAKKPHKNSCDGYAINVGCFGAIRPMKNHLLQAVSAIEFANSIRKQLVFHINGSRVEDKGEPILKNLRSLFSGSGHKLVEHSWLCHEDFLKLICGMDISMQVSLNESYNIVTCDAISQGVPVVVSPEVAFVSDIFKANPTSSKSIVKILKRAYSIGKLPIFRSLNYRKLKKFNASVIRTWRKQLGL